ncbi:hypothetical protein [Streptomyces formicae]|uniref:Uncharacterized protein n=1 Tax=Streptomyces formicae TaxID=1616117 RepID=A0ABY3WKP4_9ACTN|nr:hypothetical protein [Streptomyces formicae]UNM13174.1 hypothetical protein J4032_18235 [Streptomyces formicae]
MNEVDIDGQHVTGDIHFFDNYIPKLADGTYTVGVRQHVTTMPNDPLTNVERSSGWSETKIDQTFSLVGQDAPRFIVRGPRFTVDQGMVHSVHPAPGSEGDYRMQLPHITLNREVLPWERVLQGTNEQDALRPPWVALLVFREDELRANPATRETTTARPVGQLSSAEGDVLAPAPREVPDDLAKSTCSTIDVPKEVFRAVLPRRTELPFLAHVRRVSPVGPSEEYAVVMANRPAWTEGAYEAHLVSLEGLEPYLDGGEPEKAYVRLVSLWRWRFRTRQGARHGFGEILQGLSRAGQDRALRLPGTGVPATDSGRRVTRRLTSGYVPVSYRTGAGERTFAWYRGPFSPVPAAEPDKPTTFTNADEALIYLPDDGVFDISYAAAWTCGRLLALANADLSAPVLAAQKANAALIRMLKKRRLCDADALDDDNARIDRITADLSRSLDPHSEQTWFGEFVADGLASRLRTALATPVSPQQSVMSSPPASDPADIDGLLDRPDVRSAFERVLEGFLREGSAHMRRRKRALAPGAAWDTVPLLSLVPLDYLLPSAGLVPEESLRMFRVDPTWVKALVDGITSIGISSSLEQQATALISRAIAPKDAGHITGIVLRSALVQEWPDFLLQAFSGATPLPPVRRSLLAPDTLLFLFDGFPTQIELWEPVHDLSLGVLPGENNILQCIPRRVTGGRGEVGATLPNTSVNVLIRNNDWNVLDIGGLVKRLQDTLVQAGALSGGSLTPAGFALQLIAPPLRLKIS